MAETSEYSSRYEFSRDQAVPVFWQPESILRFPTGKLELTYLSGIKVQRRNCTGARTDSTAATRAPGLSLRPPFDERGSKE